VTRDPDNCLDCRGNIASVSADDVERFPSRLFAMFTRLLFSLSREAVRSLSPVSPAPVSRELNPFHKFNARKRFIFRAITRNVFLGYVCNLESRTHHFQPRQLAVRETVRIS